METWRRRILDLFRLGFRITDGLDPLEVELAGSVGARINPTLRFLLFRGGLVGGTVSVDDDFAGGLFFLLHQDFDQVLQRGGRGLLRRELGGCGNGDAVSCSLFDHRDEQTGSFLKSWI